MGEGAWGVSASQDLVRWNAFSPACDFWADSRSSDALEISGAVCPCPPISVARAGNF